MCRDVPCCDSLLLRSHGRRQSEGVRPLVSRAGVAIRHETSQRPRSATWRTSAREGLARLILLPAGNRLIDWPSSLAPVSLIDIY
jgi:hypothetical protein